MSDVSLPVRAALLGAMLWPETLIVALIFATLGIAAGTRWARVLCFGIAALLGADCLLAVWLDR